MNVSKIQKLSQQHADLTGFHKVCNCNGAELTVQDSERNIQGITLNYNTTRLIISDVRVSLLKRIAEMEIAIGKEAANV